jgi:hypothetical protein
MTAEHRITTAVDAPAEEVMFSFRFDRCFLAVIAAAGFEGAPLPAG